MAYQRTPAAGSRDEGACGGARIDRGGISDERCLFKTNSSVHKAMKCNHDGFHAIGTRYDQSRGVLVYFWTCESCGRSLGEAHREEYRPRFDPCGSGAKRQLVRESTHGLTSST
jgi:hypothetical protein